MDVTAWVAIVGPITTLLGGLGGYWLAGRNEDARDRRAAAHEAAARRAALAERLEEDRHAFQRDTLLELQDELQRLARVATKIILQDEKTVKERGEFFQLPPELSDEEFQIRISVARLQQRVLDPELRKVVEDFRDVCARYMAAKTLASMPKDQTLDVLAQHRERVAARYDSVNELLGKDLRRELDRRGLVELPPGADSR